jgi:hypothetical protein
VSQKDMLLKITDECCFKVNQQCVWPNNKTRAFKQKLEFWKTLIDHWEFSGLQDLPKEVGGDANTGDFDIT